VSQVTDIDVLLIGDSITERWRGTRSIGRTNFSEMKPVFEANFDRSKGGAVNGLALGSSGDITVETMWHLEHGFLPPTLNPKVFFLLIGTNDLGRSKCSKRNTLVGILHIAEHLHKQRPTVPIIFHGLLPRNDEDTGALGVYWDKIMFINRELRQICKNHKKWYFMDAAKLFLERNAETGDVHIRQNLMPDGLHPGVEGYKIWGSKITQNVNLILQKAAAAAGATP